MVSPLVVTESVSLFLQLGLSVSVVVLGWFDILGLIRVLLDFLRRFDFELCLAVGSRTLDGACFQISAAERLLSMDTWVSISVRMWH